MNNSNTQIAPYEWPGRVPAPPHQAKADGMAKFDPYRTAHRALRGRYAVVIICAVVAAVAGAVTGWQTAAPVYQSEGLLRIAYEMPAVIKPTDLTAKIDDFDVFMRGQQQVLGSIRTVERAVRLPAWQATGRGDSATAIDALAHSLTVEHPAGTDYLRITVLDSSPTVAAAAVQSTIEAYREKYNSLEDDFQRARVERLTEAKKRCSDELEKCGQQLDVVVK